MSFGEMPDEWIKQTFKPEFVAGLKKVQTLGDEEIKKYCRDPRHYEYNGEKFYGTN